MHSQPGYQQGAPAYGAAPQGYQNYGAPGANVGTPAEWGTRAIAWLIDWGIGVGIIIVGFILARHRRRDRRRPRVLDVPRVPTSPRSRTGSGTSCIKQGSTGQSIGKEKQGIKLVKDETGQPVGGGMAFVRYLVAGVISSVTCGIYGLLDYLWPLWDPEKKRLTDKIVKMSVVARLIGRTERSARSKPRIGVVPIRGLRARSVGSGCSLRRAGVSPFSEVPRW